MISWGCSTRPWPFILLEVIEIDGAALLATTIPLAKGDKEAMMLRLPVTSDKPKSATDKAVEAPTSIEEAA